MRFLLFPFLSASLLTAQTPPIVTLEIDVKDGVGYELNWADPPAAMATSPVDVQRSVTRNFMSFVQIYDVRSVNRRPAKGVWIFRSTRLALSPTAIPGAAPGQAIADVVRGTIGQWHMEILQDDGTPVGSLMAVGFPNGDNVPGAPIGANGHNMAIVGGTGAFLGARGQITLAVNTFLIPNTGVFKGLSAVTDPALRRAGGGGTFGVLAQFAPMFQPGVLTVLHGADFSPVTEQNPARAGETLTIRARSLGPVRGALNYGQPFPADAILEVNSPVDVTVNGVAAEVVNKIGWPSETDIYRVDCKLPATLPAGSVRLGLSSAWIPAPEVMIPVR